MPKRTDISTILIIGAGPIVIGQACEFDYSGTQAVKTLKDEGYRIVLVNSNPATIMTDPELADATYIEPITPEIVAKIIEKERYVTPGGFALLPTMGGQTALNCALSLRRLGTLKKFDVEMIGATADAIDKAEDRGRFREAMTRIGLETPRSIQTKNLPDALRALDDIGLPAIIRPSFTMGGTGGNTSGLALEQALVKFRIPVGNGLDIYAGKFVTFLGYEVIESPANLNFSRGLLFTNLIPLTHTGVYADYKFNNIVEAKLGIVDGWNNSTSPSIGGGPAGSTATSGTNDSSTFGKAITGQLVINAPGGNANITQSFIYSPQGEPGVVGQDNNSVAVYDIWGNWNPTFVKDSALLLGFNIDFGYDNGAGSPAAPSTTSNLAAGTNRYDTNTFWGGALYAQYKFTKVFSLAGRLEYIHSDAALNPRFGVGTVVGSDGVVSGPRSQDDYSGTLTASFNMWDNLLTRVEYRIDDLDGSTTGTGHTTINQEVSLNAVYSF